MEAAIPINLPPQLTPFIGREREREEINDLLADPHCRLLTLVGLGGSGKTRLAIEVARQQADRFQHGVHFVPLQSLASTEYLIPAVADSLSHALRGSDESRLQLLRYLRDKSLLLVLDNYEHLLPDTDLLAEILAEAPGVKLLVTSREVLSLQAEWLYPVQGMNFPVRETNGDLEQYGAVRLFADHARRVRRDFSLRAERSHVIRICQFVEGLPLGIELAASWLKTLPCAAVADEMARSLDFLRTGLRNIPERHRSLRAAFDQSWKLLTDDERRIFRRLSVFSGGFQREGAERVAGATLDALAALVDKSLLRQEPDGRYQIHELLRQYAYQHLEQDRGELEKTYDTHCRYYADFVRQRTDDISGERQAEAVREISAELENVRAAWLRAVDRVYANEIQAMVFALYEHSDLQGRYQDWVYDFDKAAEQLEHNPPDDKRLTALALVLAATGWLSIRLGRFDRAKAAFERSAAINQQLNNPLPSGFGTNPLNGLGLLAVVQGRYDEAASYGETARSQSEARHDKRNLQIAYYVLSNAMLKIGAYDVALQHARRTYALCKETGNRWMMGYALVVLGDLYQTAGDYDAARNEYERSYVLKQAFNDPEGMAFALNRLAQIAGLQRRYEEAGELYQRGLSMYRETNDQGGLATSYHGLGETALATGDYPSARTHFLAALDIAADIHWTPLILTILTSGAEFLYQTGDLHSSVELLALVCQHPAVELPTLHRAQQTLAQIRSELPPADFHAARQRGERSDVSVTIRRLLNILKTRPAPPAAERGHTVLVDPLSEREVEILRLLAAGLTNQQIAEQLTLVVGTVKAHNHNIFSKLGVSNRVQAIGRARELKLL